MILLTDYSNGNDKVVGRPGIKTFKDLKGKKLGLELTLVEQLLFLKGCEKNGINPKDVTLVGTKTNDTPQVLGSKQVDAIAAWYPIASQALATVPGSDSALHQRGRARPHLRLGRREPDEPRAAPRRLGEVREGLVQDFRLRPRPQDAGRRRGDHGRQGRRQDRGVRRGHAGHVLPLGRRGEDALQEGRRASTRSTGRAPWPTTSTWPTRSTRTRRTSTSTSTRASSTRCSRHGHAAPSPPARRVAADRQGRAAQPAVRCS